MNLSHHVRLPSSKKGTGSRIGMVVAFVAIFNSLGGRDLKDVFL